MLSITACSSLQVWPDSRETLLQSKLVLHHAVTIPPHKASIYIQNGQIIEHVPYGAIDQYYANCKFELREVLDKPQIIAPDSFKIINVKYEESLSRRELPLRYALHMNTGLQISDGGGISYADYITTMELHSAQQPQAFRLSCQHWEDPTLDAKHLTIQQIKDTLGKLFSLTPA